MGWIDLSDTDTLRRDPLWQLACSDARGMTPLVQDRPSQATLSRLLTCLGHNDNIDAVHEGLLRLVAWRLTSLKNGERPKQLTLDIDGLPIEVHGHQGGSAYHGLYGTRIYSPLVASLAETGDMVGGLLRDLAARAQVLCVTHLPAIAARAAGHLKVEKTTEKGRTHTSVVALFGKGREMEIADMIAGGGDQKTALAEARRLLA